MTSRKTLVIVGSAGAVILAVVACVFQPRDSLTRAVERSFAEQRLLFERATPRFDSLIAKKLAVGDTLEHAKKVLSDAGQKFTMDERLSHRRLTSIFPVGQGAGFLVELDIDNHNKISNVDITKFYNGP
jgi:hypothetical protein